jgi:peptidoglycan/LPS O-acetylase OafA/YrhL
MVDQRENSFDLLRLFAAFCVYFSHQMAFLGFEEPALGPLRISLASTGLYIFFALSGYLVFKSLARNSNAQQYFLARVLRIYPGAIANAAFCIVLGACITSLPLSNFLTASQTWFYAFHNISIFITPTEFELPGVLTLARWPAVNGSIWTIKYELLCYVLLFFVYRCALIAKLSIRALVGASAFAASCLYVLYISTRANPPPETFFTIYNAFNLSRFFMTFLFGAFIAALEPHDAKAKLTFLSIPSALIVFGPSVEFARAGVILMLTYFVIEIGKSRLLYSASYRRLGDLSYGFFLYAYPIQNSINTALSNGSNFWSLTALTTVLTFASAYLSWQLIEKPCLGFKQPAATSQSTKA